MESFIPYSDSLDISSLFNQPEAETIEDVSFGPVPFLPSKQKSFLLSYVTLTYTRPSRHLPVLIQNESKKTKLCPWLRERVFQPYYCLYSSPPHLSFRFMKCKGCGVFSRQTPRSVFKLDHTGEANTTRIPMHVNVKTKTRSQRLTPREFWQS